MVRPLRIHYAGAVYRVMNRGTARQATFATNQDYQIFLDTVERATRVRPINSHFVITHGIFDRAAEALTRSERLCYSARRNDTADARTHCGALSRGAGRAGHRVDCCRAAIGGREPAAQGGGRERVAAAAHIAELLTVAVTRCEA